MGNIGAEIFKGILGALWAGISHVPIMIWVMLGVGIVGLVFLLRYLTNWKVDVALFVAFMLVSAIVTYRAHWINQGYNEAMAKVKAAEAQVAAYAKTNGLIEACYARNTNASILWDRTIGKCVRANGSPL